MQNGELEPNAAQNAAQAWSSPQPPQLWRDWHHIVVLCELPLHGREPRACAVAEMYHLQTRGSKGRHGQKGVHDQELGSP